MNKNDETRLMDLRWLIACLATLLAGTAAAQETQVYRWTERDGRVSYGSTPPPGVNAQPIGGRVSVVPAPPKPTPEELEARRTDQRLRELEEQLEDERRQRQASEERQAARAEAKAECEARYREDCDDDGRPLGRRVIVVPQRPPWAQPPLPPTPRPPVRPPPSSRPDRPDRPDRPSQPNRGERPPRAPAASVPAVPQAPATAPRPAAPPAAAPPPPPPRGPASLRGPETVPGER